MNELEFISDYLVENYFASSYEDAVNMISVMGESWLEDILDDGLEYLDEKKNTKVRRVIDPTTGKSEWKIVPKERTPLTHNVVKRKRLEKDSEGNLTVRSIRGDILSPRAAAGIAKQGGSRYRPDLVRRGLLPYIPSEHLSGAEYYQNKPHGHGPGGSSRGVRKQRGAKGPQPESPVEKFKSHKARARELEQQLTSPYTGSQDRAAIGSSLRSMDLNNPLARARRGAEQRRQSQERVGKGKDMLRRLKKARSGRTIRNILGI